MILTLDRALEELIIREAAGPIPEGFIDQRFVESASEPDKRYLMLRSPGGWAHADTTCDGWVFSGARGECRHVRELEKMTSDNEQQQETMTKALRVFESMDDRAIVQQLEGKATGSWAYRIQVGGQWIEGISVDGVQEIIRRLATGGEVIRELECKLEYENDSEARFMAKAGRFIVSPDGREVLMDTAIRGKRQSKIMRFRDGSVKPSEHWYEVGISKAVRNAAEALIPEVGKQRILEDARKSGRMQQAPARSPRPNATREHPAPAAAGAPTNGGLDPLIAARKECLELLNEAKATWDEPAFAQLVKLASHAEQGWPEAFKDGRPMILQLKDAERAGKLAAFLRKAVHPEPEGDTGPMGAEVGPNDDVVDGDDLPYG